MLGGKNEIPIPIATRATPSAAPVVKAGWRPMIPAATATAPNDSSTLIASDPVSRLASAWSRSASCAVSLPSSTSRVMSRTILMADTSLPRVYPTHQFDLWRMRRNLSPDRQRIRRRCRFRGSVLSQRYLNGNAPSSRARVKSCWVMQGRPRASKKVAVL